MENTKPNTAKAEEEIKEFREAVNEMANDVERIKAITEALLSLYK